MNVGFVGLGRMGQGIAANVLGGGHAAHSLQPHAGEDGRPGRGRGERCVDSSPRPATAADVVITMVANDDALLEVTLAPGGLRDSLPSGAIHVAMGTHGVAAVRTLAAAHAEAGQVLVAAPVLGRPDMAASGQLGIVPAARRRPWSAAGRCSR